MVEKLLKFSDFFIHPKIIKNDDGQSLFKARIFVLIVYTVFCIFLINYAYAIITDNGSINSYYELGYLGIIASFLFLVKFFGAIRFLTHLMCFTSVVLLVIQTKERGGIFSSDLFWLSLVLSWITIISNVYDGLIWLIISILIYLGFYFFDNAVTGYDYELKVGPAYALLNLIYVSIAIYIFMSLYEYKTKQLVKEVKATNEIITIKSENSNKSIEYAKRMQIGSLPSTQLLNQLFSDHFIYYQPKDIVSGDFYSAYQIINHIIIVCADCTGHGVPGAMLSTFGQTSLNQIIKEQGINEPNQIIFELSNRLKALFHEDQGDLKDGMDLAVISIDTTTNLLSFFGAGRPLYIQRAESIQEFKKQSHGIGAAYKIDRSNSLPNQIFELEKGDTIYLYTDGISDQFGGNHQKKLSNKAVIEVLQTLQCKASKDKKSAFETYMKDWIGSNKQLDDMLLMSLTI